MTYFIVENVAFLFSELNFGRAHFSLPKEGYSEIIILREKSLPKKMQEIIGSIIKAA